MSSSATLIIMRHGKADQASPTGSDRDRPLLPIGFENTALCAHFLERMYGRELRVVSSEYVRARQTAETLVQAWKRRTSDIIIDAVFNSDQPIDPMIDSLRGYVDMPTVIVSHMPQVAEIIEIVTASSTSLVYKPGAFTVIEFENTVRMRGAIKAFLTPSTIRRVLQAHEAK